jgi:hypothetical protein
MCGYMRFLGAISLYNPIGLNNRIIEGYFRPLTSKIASLIRPLTSKIASLLRPDFSLTETVKSC